MQKSKSLFKTRREKSKTIKRTKYTKFSEQQKKMWKELQQWEVKSSNTSYKLHNAAACIRNAVHDAEMLLPLCTFNTHCWEKVLAPCLTFHFRRIFNDECRQIFSRNLWWLFIFLPWSWLLWVCFGSTWSQLGLAAGSPDPDGYAGEITAVHTATEDHLDSSWQTWDFLMSISLNPTATFLALFFCHDLSQKNKRSLYTLIKMLQLNHAVSITKQSISIKQMNFYRISPACFSAGS